MLKRLLREEKASAVIEYSFIMPIVFLSVALLIFMGVVEYQKACMEAAVTRGAIKASRIIANPYYSQVIQEDKTKDSVDIVGFNPNNPQYNDFKPYRYFKLNFKDDLGTIKEDLKDYIGTFDLFSNNSSETEVNIDAPNYVLFQQVKVTATKNYKIPIALGSSDLKLFKVQAQSIVTVNDAPEFIRNTDFVVYSVNQALSVSKEFQRVKEFMSKLF